MFRLQDSLQSVPNETRMIVRLGRALLPGEFRIKLSLLRINESEVCCVSCTCAERSMMCMCLAGIAYFVKLQNVFISLSVYK